MKRYRRWIVMGLIIVSIFAIVIWKNHNQNNKQTHPLDAVLEYVEQNGIDYAEDRLNDLIAHRYMKNDLHEIWGPPTEENWILAYVDMWELSGNRQLVVYYNGNEEVTDIDLRTIVLLTG